MPHLKNRNGSALLIALGCVVLMTLLIVAFLSASMSERSTSSSYSKEVNSKLLAENAINLVISQLKAGTRSTSAQTGSTVAWASQPGMVRAYDNTGKADSFYKLYSWSQMVGKGAFNPATDVPDSSWAQQANIYTDLNETVNGRNPIISSVDSKGNPLASLTIAGHSGVLSYDSKGSGTPDVEGFYIDPTSAPGGTSNPTAMPVKWLYVLKNGQIITPTGTTGTAATFDPTTGPSSSNPIVGRIAFWTDDETSKVNVNTASEGSFWDVPLAYNAQDIGSALNNSPWGYNNSVPSATEYQRIPGHPATTSLSTVFGSAQMPVPYATLPSGNASATTDYDTYLAPYLTLTPRYAPGGTKAGSRADPFNASTTGTGVALSPSAYRLYDSLDEMIFDPARMALTGTDTNIYKSTNGASPAGRTGTSAITPAVLEQDQFFLTAHSRAPEETLFGTPRISIWPLQAAAPSIASSSIPGGYLRNAHDDLIAFCSTINNIPYYFQRANVWGYTTSTSAYYQSGISGVGGHFSALSSTQDFPDNSPTSSGSLTGVQRNENLFAYLQKLTSTNIPGFGGNFLSKYLGPSGGPSDRDQILAEIFELIRSGLNTHSNTILPHYSFTGYGAGTDVYDSSQYMAEGSTIPVRITVPGGTVRGLGRTHTISGLTIIFYATNWLDKTTLNGTSTKTPFPGADGVPDDVPNLSGTYDGVGDPQTTTFRAAIFLQTAGTMVGSPFYAPYLRYQISGLNSMTGTFADGTSVSLNLPSADQAVLIGDQSNESAESGYLAATPEMLLNAGGGRAVATSDGSLSTANKSAYPFVSVSDVAIPSTINGGAANPSPFNGSPHTAQHAYNPTLFTTSGGTIQIKIYSGIDNASGVTSGLDGTATTALTHAELLQTINMSIPPMNLQVPSIEQAYSAFPSPEQGLALSGTLRESNVTKPDFYYQTFMDLRNFNNRLPTASYSGTVSATVHSTLYTLIARGDVVRSMVLNPNSKISGDLRLLAAMDNVPVALSSDSTHNIYVPLGSGVTASPNNTTSQPDWNNPDIRMVHNLLTESGVLRTSLLRVDSNPNTDPETWFPGGSSARFETTSYNPGGNHYDQNGGIGTEQGDLVNGLDYPSLTAPNVTPELKGAYQDSTSSSPTILGDWSSGIGPLQDGPFIVKPDEGYQDTGSGASAYIYFAGNQLTGTNVSIASYTPSRQVTSPIIFNSLPSRVQDPVPWRTLLFCANPAAGNKHPGFGVGSGTVGQGDYAPYTTPPDHLLLDLFWMPVVEPYAISDALSTAGKVNLNYQIVPFSYIHRSTAVRAVFKSTRVMAIPNTATTFSATKYKSPGGYQLSTGWSTTGGPAAFRYPINLDATIDASDSPFLARFSGTQTGSPDLFRSATEVCNMYLVPKLDPTFNTYLGAGATVPTTYSATGAWWSSFQLTGSNGRASPYNQLYPRLTTKSNTFQVHFRVQTLVKNPTTNVATFDSAGGDSIGGEYRGSAIIERYIDPNDTSLPDFAAGSNSFTTAGTTLDNYYRYRVVRSKSFTP